MLKRRLAVAGLPVRLRPHSFRVLVVTPPRGPSETVQHRLRPHSFRVLVVTDLLAQNVALQDVQYLAGRFEPADKRRSTTTGRAGTSRGTSSSGLQSEIHHARAQSFALYSLVEMIRAITLENFRCFSVPGRLPLRPLTLLIGENSTGKTSFLGAVRLASDLLHPGLTINFNEPPFQLGSFNEIAHYKGGRAGRAQSFSISIESPTRRGSSPRTLEHSAVFRKSGSHPVFSSQSVKYGADFEITITVGTSEETSAIAYRIGDSAVDTIPLKKIPFQFTAEKIADWNFALYLALDDRAVIVKAAEETAERRRRLQHQVRMALRHVASGSRPICIAPVRTTPQRTYDPVSDTPVPEGAHIPMVLAKVFFEDKEEWKSLKDTLDRFGKKSGLFTGVSIKALGRYESDPFQIRVKIMGPQANLVDVGYGVSQALPIVVEALRSSPGAVHLMQQPEVHMHPRSQAALGSFLGELAAHQKKQFIVETHSDYLVDRVRMDVRDGHSVRPADVMLLYFERNGATVDIYPISIDEDGNLVGEPDTYRDFFLGEERRLLGM